MQCRIRLNKKKPKTTSDGFWTPMLQFFNLLQSETALMATISNQNQ